MFPQKEIKRYGLKFIAFRNASVNITAVSQTTSLVTQWIFNIFFLCSFFRENLESLDYLDTLVDKAPRCVMRVIILWSMHRNSYCACLLFRDQGSVCLLCLHQGKINNEDISHPSSVNSFLFKVDLSCYIWII